MVIVTLVTKQDKAHQYGVSPTKAKGCPPTCFSLQRPRVLVQRELLQFAGSCDLHAQRWTNMPSHKSNHLSTRGPQPNPTPVRRRRRTGQSLNHSHSYGPDARSCPHCGRTFKRTEHLERHVRTRQSSHSFTPHLKAPHALE